MGYAFFWPPFSEHPFFVKPDGSRVTMDVEGNIPYLTGEKPEDACPAEQRDGPDTDNDDPDMLEMPRDATAGRCVWEFEGGVDVPPPGQDYPPTPFDGDVLEPPDSPQDAMSRPWQQTLWSEGHSPPNDQANVAVRDPSTRTQSGQITPQIEQPSNINMRDNPARERFPAETENNHAPEAPEGLGPFDDVIPFGTPEENQDDTGQAQGGDDVDDASRNSSGPADLVNSTSEDEDDKGVRGRNIWPDDSGDEEEEIDQLIFGDILREDDDPNSFVRHPKEGDVDAVYSRDFVDSTTEAMSMRHLATHKPMLRSCDTCGFAKAMRARRIRTSKQARERVHKVQAVRPEKFGGRVNLDHIMARNERSEGYHDTSTPGDSQGNGTAENNNRNIKMGTLHSSRAPACPWRTGLWRYHVIALDAIRPSWTEHPLILNDSERTLTKPKCSHLGRRLNSYPAKSLVILPCSLQEQRRREFSWDVG
jgi:hypothetical protein